MLKWALEYRKKGMSVMPVKKNKKPYLTEWKPYQTEIASEEQVKEWWATWPSANVAIITGKLSNLTVIDLDSEEAYQDFGDEYLSDSFATPIAKTPNGYHLYCNYAEGVPNKTKVLSKVDIRSEGGYIIAPPSQNGTGGKYQWISKASKSDIPISFINLLLSRVPRVLEGGNNSQHLSIERNMSFEKGSRDDALFHVANALVKGRMPEKEIEQLLSLIGEKVCNPPFPENEINIKIQSALQRAKSRQVGLTQDIKDWLSVTFGNFSVTNYYQDRNIPQHDKSKVRVVFSRLEEQGYIERNKDRDGFYRKITRIKWEDYKKADMQNLNIRLPFGFEKYTDIYPGNIITFSGVRNAGKTAISFECIKLNMRRHKIFYFSNEIKAQELNKRLHKSEEIENIDNWNFQFCSDFLSYTDILQTDAINIIDYLEAVDGEYYKVADVLRDIHAHLKGSAIAIVMMQKKRASKYAYGGEATEQKPSLCFNIDPNFPNGAIMTVSKLKNHKEGGERADEGYQIGFKIVNGINLVPIGIWQPGMESDEQLIRKTKI